MLKSRHLLQCFQPATNIYTNVIKPPSTLCRMDHHISTSPALVTYHQYFNFMAVQWKTSSFHDVHHVSLSQVTLLPPLLDVVTASPPPLVSTSIHHAGFWALQSQCAFQSVSPRESMSHPTRSPDCSILSSCTSDASNCMDLTLWTLLPRIRLAPTGVRNKE